MKKFLASAVILLFTCLFSTTQAIAEVNIPNIENTISSYPDFSSLFTGYDKFEGFNWKIFIFNLKANKYIIRPVTIIWASVMPQYGMDRITSVYDNASYPVRLFSCLFQKDFTSAKIETKRFGINTTMGIAGLYDIAKLKYHINPRMEDMSQALEYHHVRKGPYLVLPIVDQGNIRNIGGDILDRAFNPCSYLFFLGPISMISGGVSAINGSTYMQPIFKMADDYADPYMVSKQISGIEKFIKFSNIDRQLFLNTPYLETQNINNKLITKQTVQSDIILSDYNSQTQSTYAVRSLLFDSQQLSKPKWAELSVWNKEFKKQIKHDYIKVTSKKPKYEFRYILQKDKNAPLAILYPSIGEGSHSGQSIVYSEMLFKKGYSVLMIGSSFNWAFVKSMPDNFHPGLPFEDAKLLRQTTALAINKLQKDNKLTFNKKILIGSSYGALTGLFTAQQESQENSLGISKYFFICPPIDIFYALQQFDKISKVQMQQQNQVLENTSAITAEKLIQVTYNDYNKNQKGNVLLPFTEDEAKLAISFAMRQKLYDLIFTIEKTKPSKRNDMSKMVSNMSFYDYAQKYLLQNQSENLDDLTYKASLYSISDFLKNNDNYKIYHAVNDCFTTPEQIKWLKNISGKKTVLFDNGSHLGFLYRKEFQ